jgi:O-antigen ligase
MRVDARAPGAVLSQQADTLAAVRTRRLPADLVDRIVFWTFLAALAWCPFWFGSNALPPLGINAMLFPGLATIYELALLIKGERHPVAVTHLKLPLVLFGVVVLWILLQNATWTPHWMHHPIWQITADKLSRPVAGSISVNRDLTSLALLRLITSASAFWIALQLCRHPERAYLLLKSLAVLSCAYAAYGLFAVAFTPGRVLWFQSPFPRIGFATSTFINPNSFATYAGIGLIVICGLILRLYRNEFAAIVGPLRFRIANFIEVTGRRAVVLLAAGFIVLVALFLSQSRGGILATGLGLLVFGILSLKARHPRSAEQRQAVLAFGAVAVALAFLAFGDLVAGRIATQGLQDNSRWAVYTITLRSIFDSPLLGYGYGTFADVFPMFRDQSAGTYVNWEMAHNTYLEVFQGLGIVFGAMLMASIGLLSLRCVRAAMRRHEDEIIPCIAASVAFLVAAHSLVDFSLQIEAISITFMAVLGAGVAQAYSSRLVLAD